MQLEKDSLRTLLQGSQFQSVIQCLREENYDLNLCNDCSSNGWNVSAHIISNLPKKEFWENVT